MTHVYLDHNATTPLDERVLAAMLPYLREQYGNASSRHEFGTLARKAVNQAREQVAALVGVQAAQVVFTSGGTESNNAFIKGAAGMLKPGRLAVSAIEHPCVAKPAQELARAGWQLRKLAVDSAGRIDLADVAQALKEPTGMVSVMLANNETGVIQDAAAVAALARAAGAWMHTDAVQALGKIAVDFNGLNVHAMTLSAHKIYGPKGVGALVLDKRIELKPLVSGGGHEQGLRSGTENVAGIVGFGAACELAGQRLRELAPRLAALRAQFERGLHGMDAVIFGAGAPRVPNTSYFAFPGVEGETLVVELDKAGYAVASGAACSSANPEPSATLLAMGVAPELARGAVRLSLGVQNTPQQVDAFLRALEGVLGRFKRLTAMAV
ncbi:MAG: cysteine desulfurase [Betaproteobacteria bacterium]|nr:cysteine desulfurase [Betaproteobacteria bacterium]MBI2292087.1 cysteine desulfurase [Betaproteobacteria bacterium]MBI3054184.1 cysteine desulfurase [Betaproteobacteria bacterium]